MIGRMLLRGAVRAAGTRQQARRRPMTPAACVVCAAILLGIAAQHSRVTLCVVAAGVVVLPLAIALGKAAQERKRKAQADPLDEIMREWPE